MTTATDGGCTSPQETFQAMLTPHLDSLYRIALRMTGQDASAVDLVQDTCLRAYRRIHLFKEGTNFRAWLITVLKNIFINAYRHRTLGPDLIDLNRFEPPAPQDRIYLMAEDVEAFKEEIGDEAAAAISKMPSDYRWVFLLSTLEDLRYKEIAEVLQIPIGTVMSRLFRAREFLRKELADFACERGFSRTKIAAPAEVEE